MTAGVGDAVTWRKASGVATLTLDRPERRNVLDSELLDALAAQLQRAADDRDVRVVVLAAEGAAFCAGADLRGAASGDPESFAGSAAGRLAAVLAAIMDHPKPVVARVQGHVAGGGNGLVAACDLAVASDAALFGFSEVRLGVAPAVIAVPLLRRVSVADASALLLTGRRVDAVVARAVRLVHRVVPVERLDDTVQEYVDDLLLAGPEALAVTKQLLQRLPGMDRDEAFRAMAELSAQRFTSDEGREGMLAFNEKRPPRWVGGP